MKKIAIIGAGAVGSVLGAFLTKGGADVILVDPYKEHMDKISSEGLKVNYPDGRKETVKIKTVYSAENVGIVDIAIILTKTTFTDSAMTSAKEIIGSDTMVGTFQNGLGNPEKICEYVPKENVFFGCLNVASRILSPGEVFGNIFGDVNIHAGSMVYTKKQEEINLYLTDVFAKGGIIYEYSKDAEFHIWQKALLNISGNAVHGLVRLIPAVTGNDDNAELLIEKIVKEFCAVAEAKGIKGIDGEKFMVIRRGLCKSELSKHWPTTAQDMLFLKKKTEIDALNGAIVNIGKKLGVPAPVNETITLLVKIIENNYDNQYQENGKA